MRKTLETDMGMMEKEDHTLDRSNPWRTDPDGKAYLNPRGMCIASYNGSYCGSYLVHLNRVKSTSWVAD